MVECNAVRIVIIVVINKAVVLVDSLASNKGNQMLIPYPELVLPNYLATTKGPFVNYFIFIMPSAFRYPFSINNGHQN